MKSWKKVKLGTLLTESRVISEFPDPNKRLKVRLNMLGIEKRPILNEKEGATKYYLRKAGQFVYGRQNLHKGAFGIIPKELDGFESSLDIPCFDVNELCYPEWIYYFFWKNNFYQKLEVLAKGVGSKRINPKQIFELEIFLPSKEEQKEILKEVDLVSEKYKDIFNEIQLQESCMLDLRQTILQNAIVGNLTRNWRKGNSFSNEASLLLKKIKGQKEELINEKTIKSGKLQDSMQNFDIRERLPITWCYPFLDDITQFITDGTHQTPHYVDTGKTFLSAQNIKPFKFLPENHKLVSEKDYEAYIMNRKAEFGDILTCRVGAGIGESAVIDKKIDFAIYVSLALIKTFKEDVSSDYIVIVLNSPYGVRYAKGNVSSKGSSAGNFNLGRIRSFRVPFPPLEEQYEIVKKVKLMMEALDIINLEISQTKNDLEKFFPILLNELLGDENNNLLLQHLEKKEIIVKDREIKYDSNTLFMELVELLKLHGVLHAVDLWKMSIHFDNENINDSIDKFYADLKTKIERDKSIREVKDKKGYLELA